MLVFIRKVNSGLIQLTFEPPNIRSFCFPFSEVAFYECILCTVKCSRRDNIRRHVRNIHSQDNMADILRTIFQNYAKNNQNNDKTDDVNKPKESRNATSVIRFAAKRSSPITVVPKVNHVAPIQHSDNSRVIVSNPEVLVSGNNELMNDGIATVSDVGANKMENVYQSLDLEPSPLPMPSITTPRPQTCSNINVYRQLLSPYLKPSAKWRAKSALNDALEGNAQQEYGDYHKQLNHPNKFDNDKNNEDKYDLPKLSQLDCLKNPDNMAISSIASGPNTPNDFPSSANSDGKNKGYDQFAIYRKILRRSNE